MSARSASAAAEMVHRVTDMAGGSLARNTPEELARVRGLLLRQPDAPVLLQMLGLAPYQAVDIKDTYAQHGSKRRSEVLKCKCELCRERMARKIQRQKDRKAQGLNQVSTHNQYGYARGCRCDKCRTGHADYERERSRQRRARKAAAA